MSRGGRRIAGSALVLFATACADRTAELEARVATLERRLAALEDASAGRTAGRAAGGTAAGASLEALERALARLEAAKDVRDEAGSRDALVEVDTALAALRASRDIAMPALFDAALAAPAPRQAALLECYGRVGGPAAVPRLRELLASASAAPTLRVQAGRSLIALEPAAAAAAIGEAIGETPPLPDAYLLVHELAASHRPEAVPVLIAALQRSRDRSVRCHAATGLGHFAVPAAAEALAAAAERDEYPAVRTNALRAYPRVADQPSVRALAAKVAAADPDPAVRAVASGMAK